MVRNFFRLALLFSAICTAFGDQATGVSAGERQWVMARRSDVSAKLDRTAVSIPVGLMLDVLRTEGEWLWVGRGWVLRSDVVDATSAVAYFTQAIEAEPSAFAHVSRARAHLQSRDATAAANDCAAALKLDPQYAPAYCQLGRAEHERRRYNAARNAFDRAVELDPQSALAHCFRAQTLQASGDMQSALADFDRAIELDDQIVSAYFARGALRSQLGDRRAEDDFSKVVEINPDYYPAFNNRGNIRAKQGRWQQAIDDYSTTFRLAPGADVLTNRAHAYYKIGRLREALEDCNEAIRINPEAAAAYRQRAVVQTEMGRAAEAEQDSRQADALASNRRT